MASSRVKTNGRCLAKGQHIGDTDVSLRIPANPQILSSLWVPGAGPSGG